MKILSLFDFTGLMVEPWFKNNHECIIIDKKHHELRYNPNLNGIEEGHPRATIATALDIWKYQDDIIRAMAPFKPDLLFGFPPCTHLAVSGAAHFNDKLNYDPELQNKAVALCRVVEKMGNAFACPWFLENPVSRLSTLWREPDAIFQPYEFGGYLDPGPHPLYPEYIPPQDAYPKKTCLWFGNGFRLPEKKEVPINKQWSHIWETTGGNTPDGEAIRSATPRGFALAVYETFKHLRGRDDGFFLPGAM